jgi:hypothetical protein
MATISTVSLLAKRITGLFLISLLLTFVPSTYAQSGAGGAVIWNVSSLSEVYNPGGEIYTYAPSIIVDGNTEHIWTCHNNVSGVIEDHIYYTKRVNGSVVSSASVLEPSASGWDSLHTCDPQVVRSNITYNNTAYSWVMFYLGNDCGSAHNQIGVAFAQNIGGPWVKYANNPIVTTSADCTRWGVGMPSATSVDGNGRFLLFYNQDDPSGGGGFRRDINLGNMASPSIGAAMQVSNAGLTGTDGNADVFANFDVAYDGQRQRFYAIREMRPYPTSNPTYIGTSLQISSIAEASIWNGGGTWRVEGHITPGTTGLARNHNGGIKRNQYGGLPSSSSLSVLFADSCGAENGSCSTPEWTYDLWTLTGDLVDNAYLAGSGFSSTQGSNQWRYQYTANGSSYSDMSWNSGDGRWSGGETFCIVGNSWQHPGDSYDSVRVWVASASGTVTVALADGAIRVANGSGADGVRVRVLKNTTQIWPTSGWQSISAGGRLTFTPLSVSVSTGDVIRFVVNRNGNTYFDTTTWEPIVSQ